MRLLLFSDLHGDTASAKSLLARAPTFDVLIGAGDFCNARRGLAAIIAPFLTVQTPMVFVPGNNESYDELKQACQAASHIHVLHGNSCHINDQLFFGIGGGIPVTPFGSWSFDLDETEAARLLSTCPTNTILLSHSPPLGTLDKSSSGQSLGSRSVDACINAKKPKLLVCGHIHASANRSQQVDDTLVVNAGPQGISWEG